MLKKIISIFKKKEEKIIKPSELRKKLKQKKKNELIDMLLVQTNKVVRLERMLKGKIKK